ncbi:ribonuclease HIII [Natronobacillus azotifigens]|uniref:Ribonuclease HIII n=1 Tax=Natronobacillus azotifigens TaxID=472978 RepID=A0A9J6RGY9_9BACI|nr:ribonuclease HIII [Natronobacillus azotifigens]MCZ0704595.1 ribonuclease HIII [Natronobacillus azotifigens]
MGQIVLQVSKSTLEEMKEAYQMMLKPAPQGAVFAAKTSTSSITGYKSGKVLFQGTDPEAEANKWGQAQPVGAAEKNTTKPGHTYQPDSDLFTSSHIGSDEAGTGDYFGPITVAAAYVTEEQIPLLKEIGVKDSKNLTDASIRVIAKKLLQIGIPYTLVVMHNPKYNQLQKQGWTQGKMKTMLHDHAIHLLLEKIAPAKPDGILIDQFSQPHIYINHLKSENKRLTENTYFMTKAESHSIAVATASILARASFVQEMEKLSKEAGVELPKGASAKVDRVAGSILQKQGIETLSKFTKIHFANTKKAAAYK